ncbi:MAG: NAD(P)H-dependent oxidoreductase subunit E [Alphaproteobacteria bacterium]|nr:NAD(P)H-dependent oxidoreductase subunit E [Alphaproteobacteria bacterium]
MPRFDAAQATKHPISVLGTERPARGRLLGVLIALREKNGYVDDAMLRSVATLFRLAPVEVYELATFYPAVGYKLGEKTRSAVACGDLPCMLSAPQPSGCAPVACRGRCAEGSRPHRSFSVLEQVQPVFEQPSCGFGGYVAQGGYQCFEAVRRGQITAPAIVAAARSWPRRLPVATKWPLIAAQGRPPLLVVNADESDPGTFKDCYLLETDPHGVLEGAAITASAVGARRIVFYVRHDYAHARKLVGHAIDEASAHLSDFEFEIASSGGAYICGEETALVASLEGQRAIPREKPYNLLEHGLDGHPTLVHNVETLYRLRALCGSAPMSAVPASRLLDPGIDAISLTGRVAEPGIKLIQWRGSLRDLVIDCGGMRNGALLHGAIVGGALGSIVTGPMVDWPRDQLERHGVFLGAGGVTVFSSDDNVREIAVGMFRFLARESCGHCTPCRVGTAHAASALAAPSPDVDALADVALAMREASICGLGRGAGRLLTQTLSLLREPV